MSDTENPYASPAEGQFIPVAENPYASPKTESVPDNTLIGKAALTDATMGYLREASPWLRFLGIVGFVSCGILVIIAIASIAGMNAMASLWESIPGFGAAGDAATAIFSAFFGLNLLIGAVLCFFPSLFIWRFGVKIRAYFQNGKEQELEEALKNNKSLWKFAGILTIVYLAIIPVFIVIIIVAALASVFA